MTADPNVPSSNPGTITEHKPALFFLPTALYTKATIKKGFNFRIPSTSTKATVTEGFKFSIPVKAPFTTATVNEGFKFGIPVTTPSTTATVNNGFMFGSQVTKQSKTASVNEGFKFGSQVTKQSTKAKVNDGFKFGIPVTAPSTTASANYGFRFGSPVTTPSTTASANYGFRFGSPVTTPSTTASANYGFRFGSPVTTPSTTASANYGFRFGSPVTTPSTTASANYGFRFGSPVTTPSTTATANYGFRFGSPVTTPSATATANYGFRFGSPVTTPSTTATANYGFRIGIPVTAPSATASANYGFRFGSPVTTPSTTASANYGFRFGSPVTTPSTTASANYGFRFGSPVTTPSTTASANYGFRFGSPVTTPSTTATANYGFRFGSPVTTPSATATANYGFRFGSPVTTPSTTATANYGFRIGIPVTAPSATASANYGFRFGSPVTTPSTTASANYGFRFGSPVTTPSTTATVNDGFKFGIPVTAPSTTATVNDGFKFGIPETAPSTTATVNDGFKFGVPVIHPTTKSTGLFSTTPSTDSGTSTAGPIFRSSTTQGFQFSFSKSPVKSQQMPVVPGSPEVDEHGMYINKEGDDSHIHFEPVVALPEKIEVKTGEEDEAILFESRGKMYRFVSGEWKEKGVGVVKILEHKDTKKTRVLMRRDQVLKICCNHKIEPALSLQPMAKSDGKAWVWYVLDFSEDGDDGKMEQLALRFRNAEIANEFKKVFEQCRDNSNTNQSRTQDSEPDVSIRGDQSVQDEDDDDVIIIREEKPTAEQIAMARKFLLPDTFYLYENRPPCPGCIGCEDGELPKSVAPVSAAKTSVNKKFKDNLTSTKPPTQQTIFGGAGNLPDFASLTSDTPSDKKDGNSFVFGSGASLDFSSLASSNKAEEFSWKKTDASAPFKFAGAGQKLFGVGTTGKEAADDGDDGGTVAPLPDLVEVKTGEEDWKVLFCQRAKLYKFDEGLYQWKERGIGNLKIMQNNTKNMFRILQRREQVLKVACNHLISVDMNLKPLTTSETAWCWVANDFTDTEPSVERFAARFKTKDIAMKFSKIFTSCQEKLSTQENVQSSAYEDEEEDDEEEEDSENILFEKRVTLSSYENGTLTRIGLGNVQVMYNEDLNGNSIVFKTDDGATRCSHVICLEHTISFDPKRNVCEWKPIDYSTDEPIRKHFSAAFSSPQAAEEFVKLFNAGRKLAVDSEISEKVPTDIDDPEIYSAGGN
ncbi:E3 SUMO-protein ligase RanBP2-like [Physella acuta]|uniref:E3 SUMO-protein ligase RanBP2-like n=1 Tax=Physella acuta TaxID=109671 RepID=UPI0027DB01BF|nr:E3 SUMO-protein ligase RanBP2-like [Physella acuta]